MGASPKSRAWFDENYRLFSGCTALTAMLIFHEILIAVIMRETIKIQPIIPGG
jgi:hypothetical protein